MPLSFKKVRFALRAPGLLFFAGGVLALAACGAQGPDKEPAAEVVLSDDADTAPPTVDTVQVEGETPGFASIGAVPKPADTIDLPTPNGEQAVEGSIIDFICNGDAPVNKGVSSIAAAPPASCELVIRTDTRGDRRMLCDVAPCDAWAERGDLPQGIRGLRAEAWFTLADTFDAAGNPTGRIAKVTRLNVAYTKTP
jgi:predicted small lipoprotein YifL